MKLKSLLFGSAAAIVAITGAQAADLPIAEPVEYVQICDAFGAGFFYIPGTETCLEIGGYVRVQANYSSYDQDYYGLTNGQFNNLVSRARGAVHWDAQTQTELGTLRAYIEYEANNESLSSAAAGQSNTFYMDYAFLSLQMESGTLLAGFQDSAFFQTFGGPLDYRVGTNNAADAVNQIQYTMAFGSGFSATIALEDPMSAAFPGRQSGGGYVVGGQELPDLVGSIGITQGWGSASLSGVVGRIDHDDFGSADDDEFGWGVSGNVAANLGMINAGLTAAYTHGMPGRITVSPLSEANASDSGGGIDLTEAWIVRGKLGAGLSETISLSLVGTYADVEFGTGSTLNDYDTWTVAGTAAWTPVENLTISGEVGYEAADVDGAGNDYDVWGITTRMQRNF